MGRKAKTGTSCFHRKTGRGFHSPPGTLGLAWAAPLANHRIRLHSLPGFGASVTGALLAQLCDGQLQLNWVGAEPAMGAAELPERIAQSLQSIADMASQGSDRKSGV